MDHNRDHSQTVENAHATLARPEETLFISDLHLSPERPATLDLFLHFLAGRARQAARLYILGDLFDAWIGDDDDTHLNTQVRMALRALTASGTVCDLMHGNRDFLIGHSFCRDTGCTLLRDPTLRHFDGEPILLMHGDLLCTDDAAYQQFRRRVRNPFVRRLFLWKSLAGRRALAADYRDKSRAANADKPPEIMDVNQDAVAACLHRFNASRLIHGHTHRPAEHAFALDGKTVHRFVLSEWRTNCGEVLVHRPGGWHRESVVVAKPVPAAHTSSLTPVVRQRD